MLVVMNVVHVKEERREAFERAFLGGRATCTKPMDSPVSNSCAATESDEYVVLSRWNDAASYEAWRQTATCSRKATATPRANWPKGPRSAPTR